jgi:hypothetical protein
MGAPVGNQSAAKAKEWEQALKRAMARKADGDFRQTLDKIASEVIDKALAGEKDAWMEIGNRMDGKPAQAIVGGAEDDEPVKVLQRVEWLVVKPAA